ncbi:MAG: EscI/YscI/HrpB family type III secretion system inner rod protein [Parachlamydiales bacterium]|nr:EscI/YscI/HrpB family type III secretion system inner rod protein [Parachlamydiales bacterium]
MAVPPDRSPDRISPGKAPEPLEKPVTAGQTPTGFDSYMQGTGTRTPQAGQTAPTGPTPMDVARGPTIATSGISFDSIFAQTGQVQDSLGTVEKQLKDQNLKLKRSQSHLVKQKLGDANDHIRAAASKMGMQLEEGKIPTGLDALARFIAMVNDGQDKLSQVQDKLKEMSASGANINPGDMLSIQVKMGLAQQEIQYTTTLLGKVIQSVTQLLNTQL